jgi:hypothetical protein
MATSPTYTFDALIDNLAIMTPSREFLSRRLAKERVDCPNCGKNLTLATLSWSHRCKASADAKFQTKLAEMHGRAHRSFHNRNPTPESVEGTTGPMTDA